jgi:hypothetical protein
MLISTIKSRATGLLNKALRLKGLEVRSIPICAVQPRVAGTTLAPHYFAQCRVLPSRLDLLSVLPKGGIVAEIGVADGDFAAEIIKRNRPQTLHLIDSWANERYAAGLSRVRSRFNAEIELGSVVTHVNRSMDALRSFAPGTFDWVYLDTSHDYETTIGELELLGNVVKGSGRIAGHDFCGGNPHLGLPYGVIEAVYEFCGRFNWSLEYVTLDTDGYFSFCLNRTISGC